MGFRLSNVIGAPFRDYVTKQLQTRVNKSSNLNRTNDEALFLANKSAWVRLASSVNVNEEYKEFLKQAYSEQEGFTFGVGSDIAEKWVLMAGTSKMVRTQDGERMVLREGLGVDGAYGLGGIQDQGYRPMPGLTSVSIETAGKLGSLRFATINFKVWNMNQLDVIDALYFRLGFSMLLEWGHTLYFTNDGVLQRSTGGLPGFFGDSVNKEELLRNINGNIKDTDGNYDAMLGVVTNFNYSYNQEGGWDCSIKLVGLGSIIETQKINTQYQLPEGLAQNYKRFQAALLQAEQDARQAKLNADLALENQEIAKQNQKQQEDFAKANPILSIKDIYKALRGQPYPANPTQADIATFPSLQVVSPMNPINDRPAFIIVREDGDAAANAKAYAVGYYVTPPGGSPQFYTPWIDEGLLGAGALSGWLHPMTVGFQYQFDYDQVDKYIASSNAASFYKNGGLAAVVKEMAKPVESAGEYDVSTTKLSIPQAGPFTARNPISLVFGVPADDVIVKYEKAQTYIYQPLGDRWNIGVQKVVYDNKSYKQTYPQASYVDVTAAIDTLSNSINTLKANPGQGEGWKLTSLTINDTSADAYYSNEKDEKVASTGVKGKYANMVFAGNFTVPIDIYDSGGKLIARDEEGKATVFFETELLPTVRYLQKTNVENDAVGPPEDKPFKEETAVVPEEAAEQINKSSGLGSALEAMLTIVQFDGVSNTLKSSETLTVRPLTEITAQLLTLLPAAPLKNIFNGTNLATTFPSSSGNDRYTDPFALGLKGYNTALMSGQIDKQDLANGVDHFDKVPNVNFENMFKSYVIKKKYSDSDYSRTATVTVLEKPVYIPLGYLLFFMNNICLLYDSTKKTAKTDAARPHFYIDFNPETNLCLTTPSHMSVDPQVCLIPYGGTQADYEILFKNMGVDDLTTINDIFQFEGSNKQDVISNRLPSFKDADNRYRGRSMNILLNTQHLLDILKETADRDNNNDVYFKPFLERVLADVNKATGNINAFRVGYMDASNTVAILDDQFAPPFGPEKDSNLLNEEVALKNIVDPSGNAILPIFGRTSLVRNLDFQTNISTKMSSMIAIGARGNDQTKGSTQSSDASALYWLSRGLKDRVIKEAEDIAKVQNPSGSVGPNTGKKTKTGTTSDPDKDNKKALANKFNEHIKNIYSSLEEVDKKAIEVSRNYYIQSLTLQKAKDPGTSGAPIIPLNINLTVDGVAGINMGNMFFIPEDKLPISLRGVNGRRFGYMVVGLTHEISSNQWTTQIRGQLIKVRDKDSYQTGTNIAGGNNTTIPQPTTPPRRAGGSARNTGNVVQLVLHHTAGGGTPDSVIDYLESQNLGIHYVIGRDGTVRSMYGVDKIAYHALGAAEYSVGIEIITYGALEKRDGGYAFRSKDKAGNTVYKTIPDSEVVDLGFEYNGSRYFQDYTPAQISALKTVIAEIRQKCPNITINYDKSSDVSIYNNVFGLANLLGEPKAGSSYYAKKLANNDNKRAGIFVHAAVGQSDHSDTFPSRRMLDLLKSI